MQTSSTKWAIRPYIWDCLRRFGPKNATWNEFALHPYDPSQISWLLQSSLLTITLHNSTVSFSLNHVVFASIPLYEPDFEDQLRHWLQVTLQDTTLVLRKLSDFARKHLPRKSWSLNSYCSMMKSKNTRHRKPIWNLTVKAISCSNDPLRIYGTYACPLKPVFVWKRTELSNIVTWMSWAIDASEFTRGSRIYDYKFGCRFGVRTQTYFEMTR